MVGATRGHLYAFQEQGKVKGRGRGNKDPSLTQTTLPPSHTIHQYPQSQLHHRPITRILPFQHDPQPNRQSTSPQPDPPQPAPPQPDPPQPSPSQLTPPQPNPQPNQPQHAPQSPARLSPQPMCLQPTSSPLVPLLHSSAQNAMNESNHPFTRFPFGHSDTHGDATILTTKSINTSGRIELRLVQTKDNTFSMHPSIELSKRITASFHKRLADFWPTFGKIPLNYKGLLFEDFLDKFMTVCVEHLSTLRENYDDETMKLPPEAIDTVFESLVVPKTKKAITQLGI